MCGGHQRRPSISTRRTIFDAKCARELTCACATFPVITVFDGPSTTLMHSVELFFVRSSTIANYPHSDMMYRLDFYWWYSTITALQLRYCCHYLFDDNVDTNERTLPTRVVRSVVHIIFYRYTSSWWLWNVVIYYSTQKMYTQW